MTLLVDLPLHMEKYRWTLENQGMMQKIYQKKRRADYLTKSREEKKRWKIRVGIL